MGKVCRTVEVFVTRAMRHGGEGLEIGGLVIFRSMEEFREMEAKMGWASMDGRHGQSWCSEPEKFKATLAWSNAKQWINGDPVATEKFFFSASDIDKLYRLGGWR